MKDPHFRETVVLIIRHGPFGTFGVIINRPTDIPLSRVWPGLKELKDHKDTLFSGGPVQPDGFGLLFSDKTPPATLAPVFDEVYFSQDSKHFKDLISRAIPHEPVFRVYAGSAGWAPGQLDGELRAGGWILARGFSEAVFSPDPGALWAELIERSKQEWVGPDPAKGAEVRWVSFNPLLMPENSRPVSPLP
ncbi:MAG TPA: YqgE/AlgH family protein [Nitrospiria bacterium]